MTLKKSVSRAARRRAALVRHRIGAGSGVENPIVGTGDTVGDNAGIEHQRLAATALIRNGRVKPKRTSENGLAGLGPRGGRVVDVVAVASELQVEAEHHGPGSEAPTQFGLEI